MAEKHKSKYKAPKDLEKSQKPKARKDLKDYTEDDKKGALNPKSTGEKQSNVLRKTDKEMVDDGKYDVKYNADDRLYKDLDDAEYDPKHAAKVFKKRQDKDEKDNAKNIKDRIENLTREGKERLVREYIKRKFISTLFEQAPPAPEEEETPAEETPEADVAAEPTPTADAAAPESDIATAPTPDMPAAPADASAAPPVAPPAAPPAAPTAEPPAEPTETPAEEPEAASPEEKAKEDIAKQKIALKYWEEMLGSQTGPNSLVDTGFDPLAKALGNLSPKDLRLAKIMILRRLSKIHPVKQKEVNDKPE